MQINVFQQNPIRILIGIVVLGILLTIPASFWVFYKNSQQHWQVPPKIALYLAMGTTQEQAQDLQNKLKQRDDVADAALISPLQGLQDLIAATGLDQVLARLSYNPLPIVVEISPAQTVDSLDEMNKLTTDLRALSLVENVQVNMNMVKYHYAALSFWQRVITLVTILFIILIPLCFINVLNSLGERNQQNISSSAILLGVCSAVFAWILTAIILAVLSGPLDDWLNFSLHGTGFLLGLCLLGAGILFGIISAFILNSGILRPEVT